VAEAGDVLTFDGTVLDGSSVATYQWDFDGNGEWDYTGPDGTGSFTYRNAGEYTAFLKVTSSSMPPANDTDFCKVTIYPRNQMPAANAGADITCTAGDNITFVGKATDPEDQISLYEWDFDGDGTYDWSSNASGVAVWRYPYPGTCTARLRVTDGAPLPAWDISTTTVLVLPRNNPPVISGPSNVKVTKGRAVTLTVLALDPDPKDSVKSYAWDLDDNGAPDRFTTAGSINWTFNDSGAHVVKVTAYDGPGASSWWRMNVSAVDGPAPGGGVASVLPYVVVLVVGLVAGAAIMFPMTVRYVKRHWEKFFSPAENENMRMQARMEEEEDARDPFRGGPGNT
jgi:PKD repeat protein